MLNKSVRHQPKKLALATTPFAAGPSCRRQP
jgi:hypothetical protein